MGNATSPPEASTPTAFSTTRGWGCSESMLQMVAVIARTVLRRGYQPGGHGQLRVSAWVSASAMRFASAPSTRRPSRVLT